MASQCIGRYGRHDDDESIFHTLLVAAHEPSAHRSVIGFAAWSNFAHAVVMSLLGLHMPDERSGFLMGSAILVVIGLVLLVLAPVKQSIEQVSTTRA